MNRFWVHLATGLTSMVGVSVIVSACAHDDSSFFLQDVLAPPLGAGTSGCVFTADPTQALLSEGILDVELIGNFANAYEAVFLAGNQLIPEGNQAQQTTETSRIVIQGAVVTITDAAGAQLAYYTTLGAGFLNPSNGTSPGYGGVTFTIVDPTTIEALKGQLGWLERQTIVTYTKAFGTTLGGDHIESNTFIFPITVCKGCLIEFFTDPAQVPQPNCQAVVPATSGGPAVCFFGQEAAIPCIDCYSLDAACRCGAAGATSPGPNGPVPPADPNCFSSAIIAGDSGLD
jgi:hypothetical protein